jgi:thioredoxin-dependent peroxiredoxin
MDTDLGKRASSISCLSITGVVSVKKLLIALSIIAFSTPAFAVLKTGARATDFTTQAALAGEPYTYNLNLALKKGPVVLYFYPKAFTSGCTVEAHEFAEASGDFAKAGASVMGISADKIDTLKKFSVEACRNKFPVAVGTKAIIKAYDAALPLMGISNRTTYVIAPDGKIIYTYSDMSAKGHVMGSLKAVQDWRAAHPKGK